LLTDAVYTAYLLLTRTAHQVTHGRQGGHQAGSLRPA